jgi:hypothetical protein
MPLNAHTYLLRQIIKAEDDCCSPPLLLCLDLLFENHRGCDGDAACESEAASLDWLFFFLVMAAEKVVGL